MKIIKTAPRLRDMLGEFAQQAIVENIQNKENGKGRQMLEKGADLIDFAINAELHVGEQKHLG